MTTVITPNSSKACLVIALANQRPSDPDDASVEGIYSVTVDTECFSPATAVLDCFHEHVAIGCLDDFDISVIDAVSGIEMLESGEAVPYSMGSLASFNGAVEWPFTEADWLTTFGDTPIPTLS